MSDPGLPVRPVPTAPASRLAADPVAAPSARRGARWLVASAALHACVFAAFAAAFDGAKLLQPSPAVVECALTDSAPQIDASLPEPPPEFPDVPALEEAPSPDAADAQVTFEAADDPEFRDPREALSDTRPTIGLGGRSGTFRRHGSAPRGAPAAVQGAQAPVFAPPIVPPAPEPPPAMPGPSRPARFAAEPTAPAYPEAARRRGWEGVVHLRIDVGPGGDVVQVTVLRSSGRALLDDAAVEAARTWRFEPALADGTPVATAVEKDVRFRLDG